jgi:hypothetical protein
VNRQASPCRLNRALEDGGRCHRHAPDRVRRS